MTLSTPAKVIAGLFDEVLDYALEECQLFPTDR